MKKIVLVDDVVISNFIMKKLISAIAPDIAIFDFTDPVIALSAIKEISPDIIFLDINMPNINGWSFLDTMKEMNLDFKVIVVSSSQSESDKKQSLNYKNVVRYFSKPVKKQDVADLFSAI
ncbi:MAG TPA: response regulator [Flavipsychrobacter sp.]|nr:response regulator [Flavipsychrobacter sp.]